MNDAALTCLIDGIREAEFKYGGTYSHGNHEASSLTGIIGAFVRRRIVIDINKDDTVVSYEYDVAGSLPVKEAECMGFDFEKFEDAFENIGSNNVYFSFDLVLAAVSPKVYNLNTTTRQLTPDKPVLIVIWASWSMQSIDIVRFWYSWITSNFEPAVVDFLAMSIDDELETVQSAVGRSMCGSVPDECIAWAGCGLNGRWTCSSIAKDLVVGDFPAVLLVDGEGNLIDTTLFLDENEYAKDPNRLIGLLGKEGDRLERKVSTLCLSTPHINEVPACKTPLNTSEWIAETETLFKLSSANRISVTIDEKWWSDGFECNMRFVQLFLTDEIRSANDNRLAEWLKKDGYLTVHII